MTNFVLPGPSVSRASASNPPTSNQGGLVAAAPYTTASGAPTAKTATTRCAYGEHDDDRRTRTVGRGPEAPLPHVLGADGRALRRAVRWVCSPGEAHASPDPGTATRPTGEAFMKWRRALRIMASDGGYLDKPTRDPHNSNPRRTYPRRPYKYYTLMNAIKSWNHHMLNRWKKKFPEP